MSRLLKVLVLGGAVLCGVLVAVLYVVPAMNDDGAFGVAQRAARAAQPGSLTAISAYGGYLERYPSGRHAASAETGKQQAAKDWVAYHAAVARDREKAGQYQKAAHLWQEVVDFADVNMLAHSLPARMAADHLCCLSNPLEVSASVDSEALQAGRLHLAGCISNNRSKLIHSVRLCVELGRGPEGVAIMDEANSKMWREQLDDYYGRSPEHRSRAEYVSLRTDNVLSGGPLAPFEERKFTVDLPVPRRPEATVSAADVISSFGLVAGNVLKRGEYRLTWRTTRVSVCQIQR